MEDGVVGGGGEGTREMIYCNGSLRKEREITRRKRDRKREKVAER